MTVREGEKVHIASRPTFASDVQRHFAGIVEAADGTTVRASGHLYIYHEETGKFEKRPKVRTRIFSLVDARLVINILPEDTDMQGIRYVLKDKRLLLKDGRKLEYDLTEYLRD